MAGLAALHPHLQHAIIHDLGWRSLRPVQELSIAAIVEGCNAIVLAPTAGGKTEAAIFPLLSRILSEALEPVAVLYLCPIRALLNNQEGRLQAYARMVGLEVFKWHGDVSDSRKKRFRAEPAHILMTTPESLEVMMISARTDVRTLFSGLSAVVVDEVHAFAGDDRGAHLVSLLERLVALCGRDLQRIGLSATVGNPSTLGHWLQGSSRRPQRLIDPARPVPQRELRVEMCDDLTQAAAGLARVARHKKSLVFVESRSKAEKVAHALEGTGLEVFIHHSSVSRADRTLAEEQFARGQNTAIVCTSTMELGIDVGDLDQVLQLDAPGSVASFLQRLGRSGRRAHTSARGSFFCLSPESLLQTVALLRLAEAGWVEDVRPAAHALHVLAHQVMALILQEGGLSRHQLLPWVQAAWPFSSVRPERLQQLIDTMLERDILYEADGLLSLGARGEKLYGRKNFFELYAVFTAPPMMRVRHGKEEVGFVQALFVSMHDHTLGPLCFRLAGRAWQAAHTDWSRGVLQVRPAEQGRVPNWLGSPGALSFELCQAMQDVLLEERATESNWLSPHAARELAALRSSYDGLLAPGTAPLEHLSDGVQWHTFAGGAINRLLGAALEACTSRRWIAGNLSVRCGDCHSTDAHHAIGDLRAQDWESMAALAARNAARGQLTKFQPCLPQDAEDRLLVDRLFDLPGTIRFLAQVRVPGIRLTRSERRLSEAEAPVVPTLILPIPAQSFAAHRAPIEWIDTLPALDTAVREIARHAVVGLDVETTLEFATLCLVQIATPEKTYLVDALAVPELGALRAVIEKEAPLKVIHNCSFERRVLAATDLNLVGVYDTLQVSRQLRGDDVQGHSLAEVCQRELGLALDKAAQTSNWSRRPLTGEQLNYAALDAEVLLALHSRFTGQCNEQQLLWTQGQGACEGWEGHTNSMCDNLIASGTLGGKPVAVSWRDGALADGLHPDLRALFEAAAEPVQLLPTVIDEPLRDPLGFWVVANRVLGDAVLSGDAKLVAEVLRVDKGLPDGAVN